MLRLPWSCSFHQTQLVPPNRAKYEKRKEEYWGFKQNNADKKIDFESASPLLKSVFHPIGLYGLDCLNDIHDDKPSDQTNKFRGTFCKCWASLPIYTSNHHLTDLIENSDPLSIKPAPIGTIKLIGLLYSDVLHNKLCCTTKCFRQPKPTERTPNPPTCTCKLCGDNLSPLPPMYSFPPKHPPPPRPVERIKTLWFNSHSPISMILLFIFG